MLNKSLQKEKLIWEDYKDCLVYYDSIETLTKALASKPDKPSIEDLPDWTVPAIHIGELILAWRLKAQNYENGLTDPDVLEHHGTRATGGSLWGPMMRPGLHLMPDLDSFKIAKESHRQLLESVHDLLNLTACNWADFYNKNTLVMKFVRFALFSQDLRKTYYNGPFLDANLHKFFSSIFNVIEEHLDEDIRYAVELPEMSVKDMNEEQAVSSRIHHGIAYTRLEQLDQELAQGLRGLIEIGKNHGLVGGKYLESFVKPLNSLILMSGMSFFSKQ